MPKFLLMLWEDEQVYADAYANNDRALLDAVMQAHKEFAAKHGPALLGGEALQPQASAKLVRDGTITDGPFLETKEALGGYYLVEAADLAAATELAKDVPAKYGFAEVREIMEFD